MNTQIRKKCNRSEIYLLQSRNDRQLYRLCIRRSMQNIFAILSSQGWRVRVRPIQLVWAAKFHRRRRSPGPQNSFHNQCYENADFVNQQKKSRNTKRGDKWKENLEREREEAVREKVQLRKAPREALFRRVSKIGWCHVRWELIISFSARYFWHSVSSRCGTRHVSVLWCVLCGVG